jgi:hypothetical protein
MRSHINRLGVWCLAIVLLPHVANAQFTMRTVVKDFVTTEWTLECPDGEVLDIGSVDMTDKGIMEFMQALNTIESQVGVKISSHTVVKDFVVESDTVISETVMSADQVAQLKKIIEDNPVPSNAVPTTRARIQSVLLDGALDSFIIDLGNGCIIDLTDANLNPQVLQGLINLINQIEAENGVHISGATTVKDNTVEKDRVVSVTHLTEPQIQQILQYLQSSNVALPLWQKACGVHLTGTLHINGLAIPLDLTGHMVFQLPPLDPQTGQQPIEMIDLGLQSVDPLGPVVDLAPLFTPTLIFMEPTSPNALRHFFISQPFLGLVFANVGPQRDILIPHPDAQQDVEFLGCGSWPSFKQVNLYAPGMIPLTNLVPPNGGLQPGPPPVVGMLQINCFELQLPLRVPVFPNGIQE